MAPTDRADILQTAITLVKAGHKPEAEALLRQIIREDPHNEAAWLWFVETLPTPALRMAALRECLRHNPESRVARNGLNLLQADAGPEPAPVPPASSSGYPSARPQEPARAVPEPVKADGSSLPPAKPPSPPGKTGKLPAAKNKRPPASVAKRLFFLAIILGILIVAGASGTMALVPSLRSQALALLEANSNIGRILAGKYTPQPGIAPARTVTAATSAIPSGEPTDTPTRTATPKPTITPTPSQTFTPSMTLTPTLFAGTPAEGEPVILYLAAEGCRAFSVPVSGGPAQLLTTTEIADCSQPRIAPSGDRLAYIGSPDRNLVEIAPIDGSTPVQYGRVPPGVGFARSIWNLEWSPDSQKIGLIATSAANQTCGTLFSLRLISPGALRAMKTLCESNTSPSLISWSPDSLWILTLDLGIATETVPYPFALRESDSRSVLMAHTELGGNPGVHYEWSPDGQSLAFVIPRNTPELALPTSLPANGSFIEVAGLDKSKEYITLATTGFDPAFGVRWAPDGSGFLLFNLESKSLVLVAPDGTVRNKVATLSDAPISVQWSPDAAWISIISKWEADSQTNILEIVRPDGTDERILAYDIGIEPIVWK